MWNLFTYINLAFCFGLFFYVYYLLSYKRLASDNFLGTAIPFINPHQTYLLCSGFLLWGLGLSIEIILNSPASFFPEWIRSESILLLSIIRPALLTASTLYLGNALVYLLFSSDEELHQNILSRITLFRLFSLGILLITWIYTAYQLTSLPNQTAYWMNIQRFYLIWQWIILLYIFFLYRKQPHPFHSEIGILLFVWTLDIPLELARFTSTSPVGETLFLVLDPNIPSNAGKAAIITFLTLFLFALILLRMHFYFSSIAFKQAKLLKIEKDFSKKLASLWKASQTGRIEDIFPSEYTEIKTDDLIKQIFNTIVDSAMPLCGASAGAVFVRQDINLLLAKPDYDEPKGTFLVAGTIRGLYPPGLDLSHLSEGIENHEDTIHQILCSEKIAYGKGVIGSAAEKGKLERIDNAAADPRIKHQDIPQLQIRSMLNLPIQVYNRNLAVLSLINKENGRNPFTEEDEILLHILQEPVSQLFREITIRLQFQQQKQFELEMNLARAVHRTLFPKQTPVMDGYEIAACSYSAHEVGGDYYDFIRINEDQWCIIIGDVAGKGIPGALTMATVRSAARSSFSHYLNIKDVLIHLNEFLLPDMQQGMFVTLLAAVVDMPTGKITIARAGHDPLLYFPSGLKIPQIIQPDGIVLGIAPQDIFKNSIKEHSFLLKKNDLLIFYTDGITDTMNRSLQPYSLEQLIPLIQNHQSENAHTILHTIFDELTTYAGNHPQQDDQTLIILRKTK